MRLVFIEFPDEAAAYAASAPQKSDRVIALNPKARARLKALGITADSTVPYFSNEDHASASAWLEQLFDGTENLFDHQAVHPVVNRAAGRSFIYFSRLPLSYLYFAATVIKNAVRTHRPETVLISSWDGAPSPSHRLAASERWLGELAAAYAAQEKITIERFPYEGKTEEEPRPPILNGMLARAAAQMSLGALRVLQDKNCLLIASVDHGMGKAVARGAFGSERPRVLLRGGAKPAWLELLIAAGFRAAAFLGIPLEVQKGLRVLAAPSAPVLASLIPDPLGDSGRAEWRRRLGEWVRSRKTELSVYGIEFSALAAAKIERGVFPHMERILREGAALRFLLEALRPSSTVSPFSLDLYDALGGWCRELGLDGTLVSHGSHVPGQSGPAAAELRFHAWGLFDSKWPKAAAQTPWAERFARETGIESEIVRSGPILWGLPMGKSATRSPLRRAARYRRLIVHAGTPRPRHSFRFHIYETSDEYVQALLELCAAVKQVPDAALVVRYRPGDDLGREELEALLPIGEKVILSGDGAFAEVLCDADLLVSFSSTTIEEALQNGVPVLLYGGGGRYRHLPAAHASSAAELPEALSRLLSSGRLNDEERRRHVFEKEASLR